MPLELGSFIVLLFNLHLFRLAISEVKPVLRLLISSSSSGAEPPLIGGFGLLNKILPLCSILDTS